MPTLADIVYYRNRVVTLLASFPNGDVFSTAYVQHNATLKRMQAWHAYCCKLYYGEVKCPKEYRDHSQT